MLRVEPLIEQAASLAGGDDFGPDTWRPGLDVLVQSANDDARLNGSGEIAMQVQIVKSLANRVGVLEWRRREARIAERAVDAPVFILGLPRSGTTLLSYLLDADPHNRSLLRGECFASTPPPETSSLRDHSGVVAAQQEMDALYSLLPEFKAIHYETGAGPTECITVLGQEFRSVHFETMAYLPTYGEWHLACDMAPAYEWHRDVLQVLQWRAPGRWVLKSPCHNLHLEALAATFPDARFVVPHRDPAIAVGSLASLVSTLSGLGTDADLDREIGARWLDLCGRMLDGLLEFRTAHGDTAFFDIAYDDLVADASGTVDRLYDWLGWPVTPEARAAMEAYLAEARPGRFGTHTYELADFGLDRRTIETRVRPYLDRFADRLDPPG